MEESKGSGNSYEKASELKKGVFNSKREKIEQKLKGDGDSQAIQGNGNTQTKIDNSENQEQKIVNRNENHISFVYPKWLFLIFAFLTSLLVVVIARPEILGPVGDQPPLPSPPEEISMDSESQNHALFKEIESFLPNSTPTGTLLKKAPSTLQKYLQQLGWGKEFKIEVKNGGELRNNILEKVNKGNFKFGYAGPYYDTNTIFYFTTAMPFGLTPHEQSAWLNYSPSEEDYQTFKDYDSDTNEKYKDASKELKKILGKAPTFVQTMYFKNYNVIVFPIASTGSQMGGWFKHKVEIFDDGTNDKKFRYADKPESESKISMRIPGYGAEIMKALGINVPTPNITSVKEQIENGNINAVEWIGPHDDRKTDFYGLLKEQEGEVKGQEGEENKSWYYYTPGWWEPSTVFYLVINRDAWVKANLTDTDKQTFAAATQLAYVDSLQEYELKNIEALKEMKATKEIPDDHFLHFDAEMLQLASKKVSDTFKSTVEQLGGNENKEFKYIYNVWSQFGRELRLWSRYQSTDIQSTDINQSIEADQSTEADNSGSSASQKWMPSTFDYDVFATP